MIRHDQNMPEPNLTAKTGRQEIILSPAGIGIASFAASQTNAQAWLGTGASVAVEAGCNF
ncbi:hypothetical protein HUU39_15350 [candidate division KSB1 bacterium]|nr:hypothetical protein [bacterium]NUM66617.1 hypothetical protein [candidate division KSB1 bacterium]